MGGIVLYVNSDDGRVAYSNVLRERGLAVLEATLPEDALGLLDTHQPDVIVTDMVFRDSLIDGLAFVRQVRSRSDEATSIVVLSRYVRADDREDARAAGADIYLMKPALPTALLFEVQRALILRRSGRRLPWNWGHRPPSVAIPLTVERRNRTKNA